MNLTVNFVWVGAEKLKWLECFMIYSWRLWNCQVNLFTHRPGSVAPHDHTSLGLPPGVCDILDLPTLLKQDEQDKADQLPQTRNVLKAWFGKAMPDWKEGGRQFTFNCVDLSKSYIAATRQGIVLDLKIGPSPHLKRYVDSGVFGDWFIIWPPQANLWVSQSGSGRLPRAWYRAISAC